jgi:hypothetical protein
VTHDGGGFDAPGAPQLGQSKFEGEESGLSESGLVERGIGAGSRVEDFEQRLLEIGT